MKQRKLYQLDREDIITIVCEKYGIKKENITLSNLSSIGLKLYIKDD